MGQARAPRSKASWLPGTLYSVDGGEGWTYFGQVAPDRYRIGFLRYRTKEQNLPTELPARPLMNRIAIVKPSLGRALRSGRWLWLGRIELHADFAKPYGLVQCPVGTNHVTASLHQDQRDGSSVQIKRWHTRIDDPEIQDFEVIAAWDAEHHVPERLKADFGPEEAEWHVIGPLWRYRKVKLEYARRFPHHPAHRLPTD